MEQKDEKIIQALIELDPEKLYQVTDQLINNILFDFKQTVECIINNEKAMISFNKIVGLWLLLQSKNNNYDERNEYSVAIIKRLLNNQFILSYIQKIYDNSDDNVITFCDKMQYNHKTLQQTFSSIVFLYLHEMWNKMSDNVYEANLPYEWWICPFI